MVSGDDRGQMSSFLKCLVTSVVYNHGLFSMPVFGFQANHVCTRRKVGGVNKGKASGELLLTKDFSVLIGNLHGIVSAEGDQDLGILVSWCGKNADIHMFYCVQGDLCW